MKEIWKQIPSYEGWYSASDYGNIRRDKSSCATRKGKLLLKQTNPRGYSIVSINNKKNEAKTMKVAYLIALTFIGNRKNGDVINHKNGIKTDDRLFNIEYVTQSLNVKHAYDILGHRAVSGENHWNSKKTKCKRGHDYSLENTRISNGRRICKKCSSINKKLRRENK